MDINKDTNFMDNMALESISVYGSHIGERKRRENDGETLGHKISIKSVT